MNEKPMMLRSRSHGPMQAPTPDEEPPKLNHEQRRRLKAIARQKQRHHAKAQLRGLERKLARQAADQAAQPSIAGVAQELEANGRLRVVDGRLELFSGKITVVLAVAGQANENGEVFTLEALERMANEGNALRVKVDEAQADVQLGQGEVLQMPPVSLGFDVAQGPGETVLATYDGDAGVALPDGRKLDVAALWGEIQVFDDNTWTQITEVLPRCQGFEVEPGVMSGCRHGNGTSTAEIPPDCPTCHGTGVGPEHRTDEQWAALPVEGLTDEEKLERRRAKARIAARQKRAAKTAQ